MRYQVNADASLANSEVFFDMTSAPGDDAIDGIKVDVQGKLYVRDLAACGFCLRRVTSRNEATQAPA
jgi:hypothetical protein